MYSNTRRVGVLPREATPAFVNSWKMNSIDTNRPKVNEKKGRALEKRLKYRWTHLRVTTLNNLGNNLPFNNNLSLI